MLLLHPVEGQGLCTYLFVCRKSVPLILALLCLACSQAWGGSSSDHPTDFYPGKSPLLIIPRLSSPPQLQDFLSMEPQGETALTMAAVTGLDRKSVV